MLSLAIAHLKGGVGKTTTTLSVGIELAALGRRVLLIDLDQQSSLTMAIGQDPLSLPQSMYDLMLDPTIGTESIRVTTPYGVDLLPATQALGTIELKLAAKYGRERILKRSLAPLVGQYDVVLFDTPPSLGLLTINALVAADEVLIPLQTHPMALAAIEHVQSAIDQLIMDGVHPTLRIGGIVFTMVTHTTASKWVEDEARQRYAELLFATSIPQSTRLVEAPAAGEPIAVYAPKSEPALAYRALAKEIVERYASRLS